MKYFLNLLKKVDMRENWAWMLTSHLAAFSWNCFLTKRATILQAIIYSQLHLFSRLSQLSVSVFWKCGVRMFNVWGQVPQKQSLRQPFQGAGFAGRRLCRNHPQGREGGRTGKRRESWAGLWSRGKSGFGCIHRWTLWSLNYPTRQGQPEEARIRQHWVSEGCWWERVGAPRWGSAMWQMAVLRRRSTERLSSEQNGEGKAIEIMVCFLIA